ncbi:MAG: hypothetical protein J7L51_00970 [Desulfurococcales archaeon]|nr:hypothetical protein [Desulfurococcales archaeon]
MSKDTVVMVLMSYKDGRVCFVGDLQEVMDFLKEFEVTRRKVITNVNSG